jgi:hypothetical protein
MFTALTMECDCAFAFLAGAAACANERVAMSNMAGNETLLMASKHSPVRTNSQGPNERPDAAPVSQAHAPVVENRRLRSLTQARAGSHLNECNRDFSPTIKQMNKSNLRLIRNFVYLCITLHWKVGNEIVQPGRVHQVK